MSIEQINKQKQRIKKHNIKMIAKIIAENPHITPSEIQSKGVEASIRSIKSYKKEALKLLKEEAIAPKKERATSEYPYTVHCPKCGAKGIITSNPIQSIQCCRCHQTYDRVKRRWYEPRRTFICKTAYDFDDF